MFLTTDNQFVETWDVEANAATMIQFDLYGPCDHGIAPAKKPQNYYSTPTISETIDPLSIPKIAVEYSSDYGESWHPVRELCAPPDTSCDGYDLGSTFNIPQEEQARPEKRRIMLSFPGIVS